MEFLKDGDIINTFKTYEEKTARIDPPHIWRWVKGYVICNPKSTASSYVIREYEGKKYLFIQWKSGDYTFGGDQPFWYVFKTFS